MFANRIIDFHMLGNYLSLIERHDSASSCTSREHALQHISISARMQWHFHMLSLLVWISRMYDVIKY